LEKQLQAALGTTLGGDMEADEKHQREQDERGQGSYLVFVLSNGLPRDEKRPPR
jgi:hypothetical protein